MYTLQDYKIADIENSIINWMNTSIIITTLVPIFFATQKTINRPQILFFIILMILSCLIILIAVIPFYLRHNVVIKNIKTTDETNKNYQKVEKGIFIAEMVFFAIYFLINVTILIYMIMTYIKK
jgi:hypothetical protein